MFTAQEARSLQKAQAAKSNRTLDILRKKGKSDQTAESIAEERATYLADCTESFENIEFDKLEGKALLERSTLMNRLDSLPIR